jgi:hypothetical protein
VATGKDLDRFSELSVAGDDTMVVIDDSTGPRDGSAGVGVLVVPTPTTTSMVSARMVSLLG